MNSTQPIIKEFEYKGENYIVSQSKTSDKSCVGCVFKDDGTNCSDKPKCLGVVFKLKGTIW